jgi:hypothetical protein
LKSFKVEQAEHIGEYIKATAHTLKNDMYIVFNNKESIKMMFLNIPELHQQVCETDDILKAGCPICNELHENN